MILFTANRKSILASQVLVLSTLIVATSATANEKTMQDKNYDVSATISKKKLEIAQLNAELLELQNQHEKKIQILRADIIELERTTTKKLANDDHLPNQSKESIQPFLMPKRNKIDPKNKIDLKNKATLNSSSGSLQSDTKKQTINKAPKNKEPTIDDVDTNHKKLKATDENTDAKKSGKNEVKLDAMGEIILTKVIPASVSRTFKPINTTLEIQINNINDSTTKADNSSLTDSTKTDIIKPKGANDSVIVKPKNKKPKLSTKQKTTSIVLKSSKKIKVKEDEHTLTLKNNAEESLQSKDEKNSKKKAETDEDTVNNTINSESQLESQNKQASEIYLKSLQAFSNNNIDIAISTLNKYIDQYPNEPLIPKAYYWLGESYLHETPANYTAAESQFLKVINQYGNHPENDKQSKSLYRLAQLSRVNKNKSNLSKYIDLLQQKHPNSEELKLAKKLIR